jgi:NADH:ubiquinone oxidoreductase subunit 2 (subunit N)
MSGLVVLGAMLSVVALFYYMTLGRSIYVADPPADAAPIKASPSMVWAIGLCVAGIIVMGVMPDVFYSAARTAAAVIIP